MWPAMPRKSATSKRSSARDAAVVAAACIRAGMSVSSTRAFPSNILLFSLSLAHTGYGWLWRRGGSGSQAGRLAGWLGFLIPWGQTARLKE